MECPLQGRQLGSLCTFVEDAPDDVRQQHPEPTFPPEHSSGEWPVGVAVYHDKRGDREKDLTCEMKGIFYRTLHQRAGSGGSQDNSKRYRMHANNTERRHRSYDVNLIEMGATFACTVSDGRRSTPGRLPAC